jgi:hypothetical protein
MGPIPKTLRPTAWATFFSSLPVGRQGEAANATGVLHGEGAGWKCWWIARSPPSTSSLITPWIARISLTTPGERQYWMR